MVLPDPFGPTIAGLDPERDGPERFDPARIAEAHVVELDRDRRPVPNRLPRERGRRFARAIARPRAAVRHECCGNECLVEGACRVGAGRLREADERRRLQPFGERRCPERPARDVERSQAPRFQDGHPIHGSHHGRILLDAEDCDAVASQLGEQVGDRLRAGRVQLGRRLVEDEHVGAHRHDARDRDALLLPAGQRERLAVGEVANAEPRQHRVDPTVHLIAGYCQVLRTRALREP